MKYKIRRATSKDSAKLSALHRKTFATIGATIREGKELTTSNYQTWVAEDGSGKIIGYASATQRNPGVYFSWLGVAQSRRNFGVGAALIGVVHKWAKDIGERFILLDTRNRFKPALRAYLRLGYEITGTWVGMDGELMIRLTKEFGHK